MPALGDEFRSAREARGLTLSDVGEKIHIRSVYLNAIETEDWKAIGAPVYVRGFIRTYARFLGVDSEAAIAQYNEVVPPERPTATAVTDDEGEGGPSVWAVVAIIAAVVLVAFVGYEWWSYAQGSASSGAVASAAPDASAVPEASSAAVSISVGTAEPSTSPPPGNSDSAGATTGHPRVPSPLPSGAVLVPSSVALGPFAKTPQASQGGALVSKPHELAIRLTDRSWLRVTVDGATVIEGIYPAGTQRTFTGNAADVRAGNGGGVTISVNGHPALLLGKPGDVVEQRYSL
jgi:cytoskeleton protein RodZ